MRRVDPVKNAEDREIPVFSPGLGMNLVSAMSTMNLGPGEFSVVNDLRTANGLPTVRPGTTLIATVVSAGTYRGHYTCRFLGVETLFVAALVSGSVRVYKSTDSTTWTEITASSGAYGSTRLTDVSQLVQFTLIKDKYVGALSGSIRQDCLIICNGTDANLVYGDFYSGSGQICAPIAAIAQPSDLGAVQANLFGTVAGFNVTSSGDTTYNNKDSDFTIADAGTSNRIRATVTTGVDTDDWVACTMSSGTTLLSGKMLYIGIDTPFPLFLENFKIRIGTAFGGGAVTNPVVIWDPSAPSEVAFDSVDLTQKRLYGFDVEKYFAVSGGTTYTTIELTWVGKQQPLANFDVDIFLVRPGVSPTYALPGMTTWEVSLVNTGTHSESPKKTLKIEHARQLDTVYAPTEYAALPQPINEGFYYRYLLPLKNVSTTDRDLGIDGYRIYRQKPTDDRMWLVEHFEITSYSAGWSYSSGSAGDILGNVIGLATDLNYDVQPPTGRHKVMPVAKTVCFANDRMFVGASSASKNALYVSRESQPFRFTDFTEKDGFGIDPDGAGCHALNGDIARRILTVSSGMVGSSTIVILGEKSVYMTGGLTTNQLLQIADLGYPGTVSPYSAVVGRDTVFWLDREGQVRRMRAGNADAISLFRVDDQTKGIPGSRREFVGGFYYQDRYHLAHTPSGASTNTRSLIWNDLLQKWECTDRPAKPIDGMTVWDSGTAVKAYYFAVDSSNFRIYNFEDPTVTTDLNSNIAVQFTTGEIKFDALPWFMVNFVYAMIDDVSSGTMTITRTYRPTGETSTSTINIDTTEQQVVKHDGDQTGGTIYYGCTAKLTVSYTAPGGTKLYSMKAEIDMRSDRVGAD